MEDYQFGTKKPTPVINVHGMVKLLMWLPGETAKQFRSTSAVNLIKHLGGDLTLIDEINVQEQVEEIIVQESEIEVKNQVSTLQFSGIFQGRENEIRITPDNKISVFDFIKVVGGQSQPRKTWNDILDKYENEVVTFRNYFQFLGQGQKPTPVINVHGMVKLLMWLPGETAKQFRSTSAEILVRYLGGDLTLIDEIKKIDEFHIENPDNIAQIFRNEVINKQIFTQDLINTSNKLISYFGDKKDIFYMFSFMYNEEWYVKYGIVGELREFHARVREHMLQFTDICFHNVIQCKNIDKVESDFKQTSLVSINKCKIPKKYGGNHTEIIKLSEIITVNVIKEEMVKVAGDNMIDPLPKYIKNVEITESNNNDNLNIEKEKTKQIEFESNTKQKQIEFELKTRQIEFESKIKQESEKTKQKEMEINLELKKLEYQFELRKLELQTKNQSNSSFVENPVKEYFEKCTIHSNNRLDTIKMSDIYKKFVEWLKIHYPNQIFSQRQFTTTFNKSNTNNLFGVYDQKISNLNGNTGVRYIKYKINN